MRASSERPLVILLAHYFLPANTSGVQRASRMYRYLPESGYDVHVICAGPSGPPPGLPQVHYVPDETAGDPRAVRNEARLAKLQRLALPYDEKLPWAAHAVVVAENLLRQKPVAAVISTSPPTATHAAAWWLRRRHGLKWIADFRDPILGNPGRGRKWAQPYDLWLENRILRSADAVVGVTDAFVHKWQQRCPEMADKLHVIWNGFDPEEQVQAPARKKQTHREILHAGILYPQRHPLKLFAALDRLTETGRLAPDSLKFRFLGGMYNWSDLAARPDVTRLLEKGMIELIPELPRTEAQMAIAAADILFLIDIVNTEGSGYTVPAKIFDYLLTGRPLLAITDHGCPVDRILQQSAVPFIALYHDDSEETLDSNLMRLSSLPEEATTPSPWFFETFDGRRQASTMARLLDRIRE